MISVLLPLRDAARTLREAAASVLKAVCHRHDLRHAIEHDPLLVKRLEHALAECGLMLEAMERRR